MLGKGDLRCYDFVDFYMNYLIFPICGQCTCFIPSVSVLYIKGFLVFSGGIKW